MNIYNIDEIFYKSRTEIYISGWVIKSEYTNIKVYLNEKYYCDIELNIEREDVRKVYNYLTDNKLGFEIIIESKKYDFDSLKITLCDNEVVDILNYSRSDLNKLQSVDLLKYHIDYISKIGSSFIIKGWCISKFDKEINLYLDTYYKYNIIKLKRQDVNNLNRGYITIDAGFEIIIEECKDLKNNYLCIDYNNNTKRIDLYKQYKKSKTENSKLLFFLNNISINNLKKSLIYIKSHGIKSFLIKIKDKYTRNISIDMYRWLKYNYIDKINLENQRKEVFKYSPIISIVVPTYNTPEKFLREMIESVINQTYINWELCIADGSIKNNIRYIIEEYKEKDSRIKVKYLERNKGISENTNEALSLATGDYIALLDHDDLLDKSALFEVVTEINLNDPDFIYTDEAIFEKSIENIINFHFKPDFSPDTLRSNNYITHFSVFRKKLLDEVGMFRSEYDGSQDYDMILRLTEKSKLISHIQKPLYYWRSHPDSVAGSIDAKPYALISGKKAIESHLKRLNLNGIVEYAEDNHAYYRVKYNIYDDPLVSILIPNKDHIEDLERCINSIIKRSTYKNIDIIIIENNSEDKLTFDYYKKITDLYSNIRVVKWEYEFNYSAINNFGFEYARGDYIILLNNDTEIITECWIEEMLMFAQREDVGAVGAKLYYPDDTIQHAGIVVGIGGIAGHAHKYFDNKSLGYMYRLKLIQNVSAVTGACVMIKSDIFREVNGLDENNFKVALNDVDLCLKIREKGYLIIFNPNVELYHYESKSRGYEDTHEKIMRFNKEAERFKEKWNSLLEDPYYNKNLTLDKEDFSLRIN